MSTPEQDSTNTARHLLALGEGVGSKVEQIKINSNYLRGRIAEERADGTPRFS